MGKPPQKEAGILQSKSCRAPFQSYGLDPAFNVEAQECFNAEVRECWT